MSEVKNEKGIHGMDGSGGGLAKWFQSPSRVRKILMGSRREREKISRCRVQAM